MAGLTALREDRKEPLHLLWNSDLPQLLPSPCYLHSYVCVGVGVVQEDEAPGRSTWDGEPICSGRNPGISEAFFPETSRHFYEFHGLEEREERSHG